MTAAIPSFTAPVAPQQPNPGALPPPASPSNPGFAKMLSQTQQSQALQSRAQPRQAPDADKAPQAEEVPAPEHQGGPRAAERSAKADKPNKAEKPAKTESRSSDSDTKVEGEDKPAATDETDGATRTDPALADWLANLHLPPATPQAGDAAKGGAAHKGSLAGGDEAVAALKGGVPGGADAARADKRGDAAEALGAHHGRGKAEPSALEAAKGAAERTALGEGSAEQQGTVRELAPAQDFQQHLNALSPAGHTSGPARTAEAAAPVAVQMPVPATAPEFAQSLGMQVSVLARDGVQQAELHLNPAEMGPISIQIAIDGTQAQVNFGADSAATRQIIENGLPELAASLRDAGFTLSGGGVHSQARGNGEGTEGRGQGSQGGSDSGRNETDVTVRRSVSRVSAGGVDLYA